MQAGYFLTIKVLINITAMDYAYTCYPTDTYIDCPNTAMEAIITPYKGSYQVTYKCNFLIIASSRCRLSGPRVYNFN